MHQIQQTKNIKNRYFRRISEYWTLSTGYCAALALSGCMGVYDGGFECPPGEGVGCKSISEVNHMVNEGELPKKENAPLTKPCEQCNPPADLQQKNPEESLIWYSPQVWEEA